MRGRALTNLASGACSLTSPLRTPWSSRLRPRRPSRFVVCVMRSLSAHSPHSLHLVSVHCRWRSAEIGPLAHVPPLRRRVDVHREEPAVQDGVERGRLRAEDQDRGLQERRRHRGGQEVMPYTPSHSPCTLPVVQRAASPSHPSSFTRIRTTTGAGYPLTRVIVPCTLEPALEGPVIVALSIVFAVFQKF